MIFDTMQFVFKMDMVDLGALNLKEAVVGTEDGLRAGQGYGKALVKSSPIDKEIPEPRTLEPKKETKNGRA